MIFPIPGGKKIGSHYLPRYTRYRVIAGRVIKGGHCISLGLERIHQVTNMICIATIEWRIRMYSREYECIREYIFFTALGYSGNILFSIASRIAMQVTAIANQ